jgi:hypothetical protein
MGPLKAVDIAGVLIKVGDLVVYTRYSRDTGLYIGYVSKITDTSVIVHENNNWNRRITRYPSHDLLVVNNNKGLLDKAKSLGLLSNKS